MIDKELLKEYHERNIRWTNESLRQLSFSNNLILSLGVGFLSFAYKNMELKPLSFTLERIDWGLTFCIWSITLIALSILFGLVLALSRLWDFRIVRHINQTRQRMYEHSGLKLDEETPDRYSFIKRWSLFFELFSEKYPRITLDQCKAFSKYSNKEKERIEGNFKELRAISYNLGLNTWGNTKFQIVLFAIGILLFSIDILFV